MIITSVPKTYANLGEVMAFANTAAIQAFGLMAWADTDGSTYAEQDIAGAWKTWVTEEPMVFTTHGQTYIIPSGFLTDFTSIPRAFRWLFSVVGAPHQVAAVAHDYMYSTAACTRAYADMVFLDACKAMGVSNWKAQVMYRALRVGGWPAWNSNRRKLLAMGHRWRFLDAAPAARSRVE